MLRRATDCGYRSAILNGNTIRERSQGLGPPGQAPYKNCLQCIYDHYILYIRKAKNKMAVTMTSIRLDTDLADEAVKVLGAKSRTEAVHVALREIVALTRFKTLMKKNAGKLKFSGLDE